MKELLLENAVKEKIGSYTENSGACRNRDNKYDEIGYERPGSLQACQQRCNEVHGCGAVSWNGNSCYMTSCMASTTSERSWKCYSKGKVSIACLVNRSIYWK